MSAGQPSSLMLGDERSPIQVNAQDDSPKRVMASGSHAQSTLPNAPLPETFTRPTPKHRFEGHRNNINSFIFLHDNIHIVSGSRDGTMCKWDCDTGLLVGEPWQGEGRGIGAVALSPDGNTIACGREDGSVQRWNTDGTMIESVWTGHSKELHSLSWSPGGNHLASGGDDKTILIQKANNGEVAVGPIKTDQDSVMSLAYSPSGDRIASGGFKNICIWDSNTGKLLVRPIEDLGNTVTSVVWSSDGSKLYSASDEFARVFDSVSGALLHRFPHEYSLWSVALSPKHNVLACVGDKGAQLWDTESYEPLGHPFRQGSGASHRFVSFSPDGRYLACSGYDNKVSLWIVHDIAPQLALSSLDVDATKLAVHDVADEGRDDPYCNYFFQSSHTSLRFPLCDPSPKRRLWNVSFVRSLFRSPANGSIPLKARLKRRFFARHASNSPLQAPANSEPAKPKPQGKGKLGAEGGDEEHIMNDCFAHITSAQQNNEQREESSTDAETYSHDGPASPSEFDTNQTRALWKVLIRAQGKVTKKATMNTHDPPPDAVEVYAARGFKRYVAYKRKDKIKSLALTTGASTTAAPASGSSQAGASSHGDPALAHAPSQAQLGSFSQSIAGYGSQSSQASGGLTTYPTNNFSHSDSGIEGTFNKFLDKICFPRGHFYEDT
ncbi:WD40 repeat-like protein [Rhizopogon salebrosus TDB-379]|nr:WD40 repeat-like protein [Rhizopogon salebrosus TDB-379]